MSLSKMFNRFCYQMEVWGLAPTGGRVLREIEKEGWQVQVITNFAARVSSAAPAMPIYLVYTPEGDPVQKDDETRKRYHEARVKAAQKIYGPHM